MKRLLCSLLCTILLCGSALGEDFLVNENTSATTETAISAPAAAGAELQAAIQLLSNGNLLDALNALSKISNEPAIDKYSDYGLALLSLKRENPSLAIELLTPLSGFLDSDYQLALAKALQLHRFMQDDEFGYVDASGAWKVAPQFDWAERVFRAESATSATFADNADSPYLVAKVFSGTTIATKQDLEPADGKYGLVRNDGTLVVPVKYSDILWTVDGIAAVTDGTSSYLYDIATATPIGSAFEEIGVYQNGYINCKQNGLWAHLNPVTGSTLGDGFVWEDAKPFSEGKAGVAKDALYGFINESGKIVIELQYTDVAQFGEGLAGVRVKKRWGFIDTQNNIVIKPAYADVKAFEDGICAVKKGNSWGLLNIDNKWALNPKYGDITDFDPITHRAWIRQNKLWGMVTASGTVVVKPAYGTFDAFNGNTLARVSYKGQYSFVDAGGKTRIFGDYTNASAFTADYAGVLSASGQIAYLSKTSRSFTLDTDVPVESRCGFIEGRKLTITERTVIDEKQKESIVEDIRIDFLLYDYLGKPITVPAYVGTQG